MNFEIFVDDNYHHMEESARYKYGNYESYELAVITCKNIVDSWLTEKYKCGMKADELYEHYIAFGEDPFILPKGNGEKFSAWTYAKIKCSEICRIKKNKAGK